MLVNTHINSDIDVILMINYLLATALLPLVICSSGNCYTLIIMYAYITPVILYI